MNDFKATPEQWDALEECTHAWPGAWGPCILELRARVEALEANSSARLTSSNYPEKPDSSLVERVHSCIVGEPECGHMQARAAIREVAAWLKESNTLGAHACSELLGREAER